jgi:hypothetical protein
METIVCEFILIRILARLCKENKNFTVHYFFHMPPPKAGVCELLQNRLLDVMQSKMYDKIHNNVVLDSKKYERCRRDSYAIFSIT